MVKEYGWAEPPGKTLPGKYKEQIIDFVKDFHFESLHQPIKQVMLSMKPDSIFAASSDVSFKATRQPRISVRFRAGNLQDHMASLRNAWKSVAGDQDFEHRFLGDQDC